MEMLVACLQSRTYFYVSIPQEKNFIPHPNQENG